MCVDVSHLVFESFRYTNNQVVDNRFDSAKGSDVLAGAMVQLDVDDILSRVGEANRKM